MDSQAGTVYDVAGAARRLGISHSAVRKRIARGALAATKGEDGQWRITIPAEPEAGRGQESWEAGPDAARESQEQPTLLTSVLLEEVAFLRREVERKDILLAEFAKRLPILPETCEEAPRAAWWHFWRWSW